MSNRRRRVFFFFFLKPLDVLPAWLEFTTAVVAGILFQKEMIF